MFLVRNGENAQDAVLGDGSDLGARVRYSWEQPTVLGSAGGPRHALAILGADTFFIVNGDTLTDVDLARLAAAHAASNALVTLALVPNRAPLRYGGATMADDAAVTGFVRAGEQTARSLGLDGTVRNASDGSVEAVFSGPADKVAAMLRLCADGPPDARVTKVTVIQEGGSAPRGFKVLGTHWR